MHEQLHDHTKLYSPPIELKHAPSTDRTDRTGNHGRQRRKPDEDMKFVEGRGKKRGGSMRQLTVELLEASERTKRAW